MFVTEINNLVEKLGGLISRFAASRKFGGSRESNKVISGYKGYGSTEKLAECLWMEFNPDKHFGKSNSCKTHEINSRLIRRMEI